MRDENQEPQNGERPDYQNYYPYQNYYGPDGRPKKKKHTGLLVVLVILALISGAASWAVNVLGLRVDIGQNSIALSVGEKRTEEAEQPEPGLQQALADPTPEAPAQETSPAAQAPEESTGLNLADTPLSVENRPSEDENALSLQEIYAKVIPSVASISCVLPNGTSSGTGIVMSQDGYVITNYHVIESAQQIYVTLENDSQYVAELVGGDETSDLAVLKVDATDLTPAEFGDSDALRVGDTVVAIGDPLGAELRGTMTDGIVSAINRDVNLSGRRMTMIQTNAALNSGNSGGPLINCYGQVIGINTMKMRNYSTTSSTVEGLGFAIPMTSAKPILDELIEQGYVSGRPAIGIQGETLDLRAQLFFHMPSGVVVTGVVADSDAAQKGLEPDDIIVAVNDEAIGSLDDLVRAKSDMSAGDTVRLTICRSGKYYYVDIVLMDQISPEIY